MGGEIKRDLYTKKQNQMTRSSTHYVLNKYHFKPFIGTEWQNVKNLGIIYTNNDTKC